MLILSRKIGEALVIDETTTIRLLELKGGQIKLGIEAPNSVSIHREEVFLRIIEENKKAAEACDTEALQFLSGIAQEQKK